jgi:hypothetical protein
MAKLKTIAGDLQVNGAIDAVGGLNSNAQISITTKSSAANGSVQVIRGDLAAAQAAISDMADDGKLTPVEKQALLTIWNGIESERPRVIAQAHSVGIQDSDASLVAYNAAYTALYNYLFGTGGVLVSMETTATIIRATMVSLFNAYYSSLTISTDIQEAMLQGISDAQAAADAGAKVWISSSQPTISTRPNAINGDTWVNTGSVVNGRNPMLLAVGGAWLLQDSELPLDPAAYYSFDDHPDFPDRLDGISYTSNFATADGWTANANGPITVSGGSLVVAANQQYAYRAGDFNGKNVRVKITAGSAGTYYIGYRTTGGTYKLTAFPRVFASGESALINASIAEATSHVFVGNGTQAFTMQKAQIGTGEYSSPTPDNSGKGNNLTAYGVTPCDGISGKGIMFDGVNDYLRTILPLDAVPDVWNIEFEYVGHLLATRQTFVNYKGYSNTAGYIDARRQENTNDLAFSYCSGSTYAMVQFSNFFVGFTDVRCKIAFEINWATGVIKAWRNGAYIGSVTMATPVKPTAGSYIYYGSYQGTNHFTVGTIDELVLFFRALTDAEARGLYLAKALPKVYTLANWQSDQAASDSVITPGEKLAIYSRWYAINGDGSTTGTYWTARAAADALSFSTTTGPLKTLIDARDALNAYLYTSTGILSAAYWLNNIQIVPATYQAAWATYDAALDALDRAIGATNAANAAAAAQVAAEAYSDGLDDALRLQTDRAITYYTQTGDPSTAWTTDALKVLHKGDYWRTAATAQWKVWTASAWSVAINDPLAQAAADAAQDTADGKTTVFATLALAQAGAEIGDLFLDAGLLYRATVAAASITLANSTRLTPKSWGSLATAPSSGMIANDTYYNTTLSVWYYYSGSAWVSSSVSIADAAPQYRGIGILAGATTRAFRKDAVDANGTITNGSSVTPNVGDWMINYAATNLAIGIYVWGGSTWTASTDYKYIGGEAAIDLCYLGVGGITVSGLTTFLTAIIKTLFAKYITILSGGAIKGGTRFNDAGTDLGSGTGFWLGASGILKAVSAILDNCTISGEFYASNGRCRVTGDSVIVTSYDQRVAEPSSGSKLVMDSGGMAFYIKTSGTWSQRATIPASGGFYDQGTNGLHTEGPIVSGDTLSVDAIIDYGYAIIGAWLSCERVKLDAHATDTAPAIDAGSLVRAYSSDDGPRYCDDSSWKHFQMIAGWR